MLYRLLKGLALIIIAGVGIFVFLSLPTHFDVSFSSPTEEERTSSWRFIVLPDLHNTEPYLQRDNVLTTEEERAALQASHTALYRRIHDQLGGDLVVMPGDINNGEWHTDEMVAAFGGDISRESVIRRSAEIVYPTLQSALRDAGYPTNVFVLGDHEVADNPWLRGTPKDQLIHVFKETVDQHFTTPVRDRFLASGDYSAPVGTPYEGTSYAIRYRDTVFISVDVFHHKGSALAYWGDRLRAFFTRWAWVDTPWESVSANVTGPHLDWVEAVLKAARETDGVAHIVVQGHSPVLFPVGGRQSSMLYLDGASESPFWQLLRDYDVDLYIAGEVHANTLIEDGPDGPVQLSVKAGNDRSMVSAVDISPTGFRVSHFRMVDELLVSDGTYARNFENDGTMFDGILEPVDRSAPILRYDFDNAASVFSNSGEFGKRYDLICLSCEHIDDANGQGALLIRTPGAKLADRYVSPIFMNGQPGTFSVTFRAMSPNRAILLSTDFMGGADGFKIIADDNRIVLLSNQRTRIDFDTTTQLLDGDWHTLVLRYDGGRVSQTDLWIDGQPVDGVYNGTRHWLLDDGMPRAVPWKPVSFGADTSTVEGSAVALDDIVFWARALSDNEVDDFLR